MAAAHRQQPYPCPGCRAGGRAVAQADHRGPAAPDADRSWFRRRRDENGIDRSAFGRDRRAQAGTRHHRRTRARALPPLAARRAERRAGRDRWPQVRCQRSAHQRIPGRAGRPKRRGRAARGAAGDCRDPRARSLRHAARAGRSPAERLLSAAGPSRRSTDRRTRNHDFRPTGGRLAVRSPAFRRPEAFRRSPRSALGQRSGADRASCHGFRDRPRRSTRSSPG